MERTLSPEELAAETDLPFEVLDWMAGIGILKSGKSGPFVLGDAFRAKMIAALLEAGFSRVSVFRVLAPSGDVG